MYIRYPVRNFHCPFCGARMPTEEYRGWKPWVCPGCSRELQFSTREGCLVQLCFFALALLALYIYGLRNWQLFAGGVALGAVLTVVLIGPLGRVLPQHLEPYEPPVWQQPKLPKYTTLSLHDAENSDTSEQSQPERKPQGKNLTEG